MRALRLRLTRLTMRRAALAVGCTTILATSAAGAQDGVGWRATERAVREAEVQHPGFEFDERRMPDLRLPAVLPAGVAGSPPAAARASWRRHRAAVLERFRANVYGRTPDRPARLRFERLAEDPRAMGGAATLRRVAIHAAVGGRAHRFELVLFLPNARRGPVPVLMLLNNRPATNTDPTRAQRSGFWPAEEVVARGYGIAAIQVGDVAPDDSLRVRDGVLRLFEVDTGSPRPADAWGALAAWAWGASRALDYLVTDPRVDARRVAVIGHSRGGKAALWAGATDERFALVVANESGEGGAALARRPFGETIAAVTDRFPHWFAPRYRSFAGREAALPVDQHMLLALVAPRGLYVASADEDLWSDPRGEFLALAHASPVFALWGDPAIRPGDMPPLDRPLVVGRRGYHVRRGGHDLTPYDWARFMDFADALWPPGAGG